MQDLTIGAYLRALLDEGFMADLLSLVILRRMIDVSDYIYDILNFISSLHQCVYIHVCITFFVSTNGCFAFNGLVIDISISGGHGS